MKFRWILIPVSVFLLFALLRLILFILFYHLYILMDGSFTFSFFFDVHFIYLCLKTIQILQIDNNINKIKKTLVEQWAHKSVLRQLNNNYKIYVHYFIHLYTFSYEIRLGWRTESKWIKEVYISKCKEEENGLWIEMQF